MTPRKKTKKSKPTVTLCMLVSQDAFRHARTALQSALKYYKFDEIFIALSPKCGKAQWGKKIAALVTDGTPVTIFPGTSNRNDVAKVRFGLYDKVKTDFILNVDDDDGVLGAVDLAEIPDDVGMFHSDIIAVCTTDSGFRKAGDVFIRDSCTITKPEGANMFRGSVYGYRTSAWADVSKLVDRSEIDYEEWRVVYHMISAGWKDHYVPRVLQFQRTKDYNKAAHEQAARGRSWERTVEDLKKGKSSKAIPVSPDPVIGEDRYWENWNDEGLRDRVRACWAKSKGQPERRTQLYDFLDRLLPKISARAVLDFGCGPCEDYPYFRDRGISYSGVDVTKEMLAAAVEQFPKVNVSIDDIFNSKFSDGEHPFVLNSAVLLHLPFERIELAISELYRITGQVLVIRYTGVGMHEDDRKLFIDDFIFNRITEKTLMGLLKSCNPTRLEVERGQTPGTEDVYIATLWK